MACVDIRIILVVSTLTYFWEKLIGIIYILVNRAFLAEFLCSINR